MRSLFYFIRKYFSKYEITFDMNLVHKGVDPING